MIPCKLSCHPSHPMKNIIFQSKISNLSEGYLKVSSYFYYYPIPLHKSTNHCLRQFFSLPHWRQRLRLLQYPENAGFLLSALHASRELRKITHSVKGFKLICQNQSAVLLFSTFKNIKKSSKRSNCFGCGTFSESTFSVIPTHRKRSYTCPHLRLSYSSF